MAAAYLVWHCECGLVALVAISVDLLKRCVLLDSFDVREL
jgi:hypothetical protein